MNRRIRSIFWLMTLCILGINAFQAYWLWTTYQLNHQQVTRTVQDALFQVLESQQVEQARRLVGSSPSDKIRKPSRRIIRHLDSDNTGQTHIFLNKSDIATDADNSREKDSGQFALNLQTHDGNLTYRADTLARRISDLLVLGWADGNHIDLRKFEAAYKAELKRRGVTMAFQLDTLTIKPKQMKGDFLVFDSRAASDTSREGKLHTSPLPVNPLRHLFVKASFFAPTPYLLRRMGWLLGSSLLLLILTTGCFLFMLTTILKQKKLSEIKNDFINNMTHELKTPLSTVTAAVEAMQHFGVLNDPQKTKNYLGISQNNLQRLSGLVDQVLNLAVVEERELELQPERLNLAALADDLIANHQVRAIKPVVFDINIPLTSTVLVDRVHFTNVLNNLIDNAIHYSYDQVKIRLDFRQQQSGWQLSVADDGIGIPKAYQSDVFERFFRVPTGDLHPVRGFGLGLAYVRQVVERHGGKVSVLSEPGKGSSFILDF